MAETVSLRCRITALETELDMVKNQLLEARNGTAYLVGMLGHQTHAVTSIPQDQEMVSLREQLDKALKCNAHLERLLAASRQARALLETRGSKHMDGGLRALERGDGSEHGDEESFVAQRPISFTGVAECIDDLLGSIDEDSQSGEGVRDGWTAIPAKKVNESMVRNKEAESLPNGTANGHNVGNTRPGHLAVPVIPPQEAVETGTARSIHIRSCSIDDVKQYDIPPLSASQWANPPTGPRWPNPEPRPYARRPPLFTPSYDVTHMLYSRDPRLRRAVLIENIPVGMTIADILNDLKSDRIIDARSAGTAGMKTVPPIMTNTAYVEFLDHEDAKMFLDVYEKHKMFRLRLVETPTRPLRRSRPEMGVH